MMTIWAETMVSAAHRFLDYPIHGHTYVVRVAIRPNGFVNAEALANDLRETRSGVDHQMLNDVLAEPTMECLAEWFAARMSNRYEVAEVTVTRPEGIGCTWRPDGP
jgi:6-pyruvoyl-tetrahydropterin synthase